MRVEAALAIVLTCAGCASSEEVESTRGNASDAHAADGDGAPDEDGDLFPVEDGAGADATADAVDVDTAPPADTEPPADTAPPCATTISYGSAWLHPSGHPDSFDTTSGLVTWDGSCTTSGSNSFATLSNGWKPYFTGTFACTMALDDTCTAAPACHTRVTYGPAWIHGSGHAAQFDDAPGKITWDGVCTASSTNSFATLSNGWKPYFTGTNACAFSFEWVNCGGL